MTFLCQTCGKNFGNKAKLNTPVSASSFINYLRSLRALHQLCVAESLGDYEAVLFDFKTNFEFLNEEFKLPMTLKMLY